MSDVIVCKVPVSADCPSGVKYVIPSPNVSVKSAMKTLPSNVMGFWIEHRDNLPKDRYFRNALHADIDAKSVSVNMDMARAIHIDVLRADRNQKLEKLDVEYMKALESKDEAKQAEIQALKQKLRNMPQDAAFNLAATPDELKNTIPEYLK